jgi:hypothetical protein
MREHEPGGRFQIPYEREAILFGINYDLTKHIGQNIAWWKYDSVSTAVDDIYDVGSVASGRKWLLPFTMPCINVNLYQGVTVQNARGFYNTDLLRVTLNMKDVEELIPDLVNSTDKYLKDRIIFRGQVFRPNKFYPKGQITDSYTIFSFDAIQINPEELINDRQFAQYSN